MIYNLLDGKSSFAQGRNDKLSTLHINNIIQKVLLFSEGYFFANSQEGSLPIPPLPPCEIVWGPFVGKRLGMPAVITWEEPKCELVGWKTPVDAHCRKVYSLEEHLF